MDFTTIILSAAKAANVSGALLLAICSHESAGFTLNYAPHDHGSPSYGSCQLKAATARMLGFDGDVKDLMKPEVNARWAAKYLAYQQDRYGDDDWCTLTAAYNAGSYNESSKMPGYPRNLKYVRLVQKQLGFEYRSRLSCGNRSVANN